MHWLCTKAAVRKAPILSLIRPAGIQASNITHQVLAWRQPPYANMGTDREVAVTLTSQVRELSTFVAFTIPCFNVCLNNTRKWNWFCCFCFALTPWQSQSDLEHALQLCSTEEQGPLVSARPEPAR